MKKKVLIIGFILFISIIIFVLSIILEIDATTPQSVEIKSDTYSLIQKKDEFRLDKIVIDVKYKNNSKYEVLDKNNTEYSDLKCGNNEITIKYRKYRKKFNVVLYDDEYLNDHYIYIIDDKWVYSADSINNVLVESSELNFAGWYSDKYRNNIYTDDTKSRISNIYSLYVNEKVNRINFYDLNNNLFSTLYLLNGEIIKYPSVGENLYFDYPEGYVTDSKDIHLIKINENQKFCYLYNRTNDYIGYKIINYDEMLSPIIEEGYKFVEYKIVHNGDGTFSYYPIYEIDKMFKVSFYTDKNTYIGDIYVKYGEGVTDEQLAKYNIKRDEISIDLKHICCDLNVIVYKHVNINCFYIDDEYYKSSVDMIDIPYQFGYYNWWELRSGTTNIYDLKSIRVGKTCTVKLVDYDIEIFYDYYSVNESSAEYLLSVAIDDVKPFYFYLDEELTDFSTDMKNIGKNSLGFSRKWQKEDMVIYAKLAPNNNDCNNSCSYVSYGDFMTICCEYNSNYKYISANCHQADVKGLDLSVINRTKYILIDETILYLTNKYELSDIYTDTMLMVSKDNPNLYSLNNCIYDKKTNELLVDPKNGVWRSNI